MNQMFGRGVAVANIFGLIGMDMKYRLKQQLFRKTKGNSLVNFSDVKEPLWDSDGKHIQKSVFMVFFMEGEKMRETVNKVITGLDGKIYDMPAQSVEMEINETNKKLATSKKLIKVSQGNIRTHVNEFNDLDRATVIGGNSKFAGMSKLQIYKLIIKHDLMIYDSLNSLTNPGGQLMYGYAWSTMKADEVTVEMKRVGLHTEGISFFDVSNEGGHDTPHKYNPPTHFRTNDFIAPF